MKATDIKNVICDGEEMEVISIRFTMRKSNGSNHRGYVTPGDSEWSDDIEIGDPMDWVRSVIIEPKDDIEKDLIRQAINDSLREFNQSIQIFKDGIKDSMGRISDQLKVMGVEEDVNN